MTIVKTVLFVAWCALLLVLMLCSATVWDAGKGESNGASGMGRAGILVFGAALVASVLLRWLL